MKKNSLFIPIRVKSNKLDNYPIVSGQIFFVLDTQEIYLDCTIDNELKRVLFVDKNIFPKISLNWKIARFLFSSTVSPS